MLILRPVLSSDADPLFPLIYRTHVADSLIWDGPRSLDEFRKNLEESEALTAQHQRHHFTIEETASRKPIGMISIHPDEGRSTGEIGLWIGEPFQGGGFGTRAVREIVSYGFNQLNLGKVDARIFTSNHPSRRIFEKNGFALERTIPQAVIKRGRLVDTWLFGLPRRDHDRWQEIILHLSTQSAWREALLAGSYRSPSLSNEGFIHCSRPEQILDVANRFYRGQAELVLLWIELDRLSPEVRWEPADGDHFPHVYGEINLEAVRSVVPFLPDDDGRFVKFPRE